MRRANPKFVLRTYLAQEAIERARTGDYGGIEDLMRVLERPWEEHPALDALAAVPPAWARELVVSCSS
jgi:uncharacterized protein YdiU (UPF0061 family)